MGTPIPKVDTEMAVKSCTSECSKPRPMTEEEIRKYGIANPPKQKEINSFIDNELIRNLDRVEKEERFDKKMAKRELRLSNEELIEFCKGYKTVYAAAKAMSDELKLSRTTCTRWINEAGIKFDKNVSSESIEVEVHGPELSVESINSDPIQNVAPADPTEVKQVNQEAAVKYSISMAAYKVGQVTVIVNFEEEKIKFQTPEMSFEEAAAVVELLNEIL